MGLAVAEGPQVKSDWYNFDALNIPPEHPARQEHDTFFMHRDKGDSRPPHVLRTHTSPVQIRAMAEQGAPDQGDRAGPGLPNGHGSNPYPDVPSGSKVWQLTATFPWPS